MAASGGAICLVCSALQLATIQCDPPLTQPGSLATSHLWLPDPPSPASELFPLQTCGFERLTSGCQGPFGLLDRGPISFLELGPRRPQFGIWQYKLNCETCARSSHCPSLLITRATSPGYRRTWRMLLGSVTYLYAVHRMPDACKLSRSYATSNGSDNLFPL